MQSDLYNDISLFSFRKDEWRAIIITLILVLLACFEGLDTTTFSIDDYRFYFEEHIERTNQFILAQGRPGLMVGRWIISTLGSVSGLYVSVIGLFLIKVQLLLGAIILLRVIKVPHINTYMALAVALFVIHPFWVEILTFKIFAAHIGFSLAIIIAFMGWAVMPKSGLLFGAGVLGCTYLMVTYQPLFNVLIVTSLLSFVWSSIEGKQVVWKNNEGLVRLTGLMASMILAFFLFKALQPVSFEEETRATLITAETAVLSLSKAIQIGIATLSWFKLHFDPAVRPVFMGELSVVMVFITLFTLAYHTLKTNKPYKVINVFLAVFALCAAVPCFVAVNILVNDFFGIRVITGASIFLFFCAAVNEHFSVNAFFKTLNRGVIVCLCLVFVVVNNSVLASMRHLNEVDKAKANRMLYDLEKCEGYKEKRIVTYPVNAWNQYNAIQNATFGDLNVTAFYAPWSRYNIFRYLSGTDLKAPSRFDLELAKAYYEKQTAKQQNQPVWPHRSGIIELNDRIIIYY